MQAAADPRRSPNYKKLFDLIGNVAYRHSSHAEVFSDFLIYVVGCFLVEGDPKSAEAFQKKYGKDYPNFKEMFHALVKCYDDSVTEDDSWCDPLGAIYEEISSSHKASSMGQFFTPEEVCIMMAAMTAGNSSEDGKKGGKYVSDPCSGSGRLLLAMNATQLGNFYSCVDLDPMCARMTAINMLFHGLRGQVNCGDALWLPDNWRFGYIINPHLDTFGVPTMLPLKIEDSWEVQAMNKMEEEAKVQRAKEVEEKRIQMEKNIEQQLYEKINVPDSVETGKGEQLSLF